MLHLRIFRLQLRRVEAVDFEAKLGADGLVRRAPEVFTKIVRVDRETRLDTLVYTRKNIGLERTSTPRQRVVKDSVSVRHVAWSKKPTSHGVIFANAQHPRERRWERNRWLFKAAQYLHIDRQRTQTQSVAYVVAVHECSKAVALQDVVPLRDCIVIRNLGSLYEPAMALACLFWWPATQLGLQEGAKRRHRWTRLVVVHWPNRASHEAKNNVRLAYLARCLVNHIVLATRLGVGRGSRPGWRLAKVRIELVISSALAKLRIHGRVDALLHRATATCLQLEVKVAYSMS